MSLNQVNQADQTTRLLKVGQRCGAIQVSHKSQNYDWYLFLPSPFYTE